MKILAVDTSGPFASAALMGDGAITHEIAACHGLTHSQTSLPMIGETLEAAGLAPADIDLFAAVTGPGSFTGVRIGVCEAKGMAHACGKRIVGVDALEALAVNAFGFPGLVCPILDARRSQVYCAAFRFAKGGLPERALPDDALPLGDFLARLPRDEACLFLGDGLKVHFPAVREALGERAVAAPAAHAYLRASAACVIASLRADEAVEPLALEPLYLRAPQAERERGARLKNAGGE
ncbi:MAG: tRNA (adenosine(37)-N6)-threonylcarbamoyltransferase complex dimerization subunit type 1 TsaB [Clostridia bacterium]|nr:tRNA (adenosine(37)-N6)-threonylcarbamoyltransferase complex dimerization subunit type 1 TsaB [Clostridia bacterium]